MGAGRFQVDGRAARHRGRGRRSQCARDHQSRSARPGAAVARTSARSDGACPGGTVPGDPRTEGDDRRSPRCLPAHVFRVGRARSGPPAAPSASDARGTGCAAVLRVPPLQHPPHEGRSHPQRLCALREAGRDGCDVSGRCREADALFPRGRRVDRSRGCGACIRRSRRRVGWGLPPATSRGMGLGRGAVRGRRQDAGSTRGIPRPASACHQADRGRNVTPGPPGPEYERSRRSREGWRSSR